MYNYFMLIGYVCYDIEVKEVLDGVRVTNLFIKVKRDYRNADGTILSDVLRVTLWGSLADIAKDNLVVGSRVVVKGRIKVNKRTLDSGEKVTNLELIGDKLICLDNIKNELQDLDLETTEEIAE